MPKVSILIPVYNCKKYLDQCIESALNQTLKDIEIILINDSSIDASNEIINKFSENEKIKIINVQNIGYGASLNKGIQEAQGEYISILSPEDFYDKDFLKKLYSAKGNDIIKGGFYFYPQNTAYKLNFSNITTINDNPEIINIKPSIWSAIYKKDFLTENNIKFNEPKSAIFQDGVFYFQTLYCAKNIYFIDEPLYYHRSDNENSNLKTKNKVTSIINEFKFIDKFLENKIILPETTVQFILFQLNACISNFMTISAFYEDEFISLSSKYLNSEKTKLFFNSRFTNLDDKVKLYFYTKFPQIFKFFLSIVKKYVK